MLSVHSKFDSYKDIPFRINYFSLKMTDRVICNYHNYGYCKFGSRCKNFHSTVTCNKFPCLDSSCTSRHPKNCHYYSSFGRCKFSESCAYLHMSQESSLIKLKEEVDSLSNEIFVLKLENFSLQQKVNNLSEEISSVRSELNLSMTADARKW